MRAFAAKFSGPCAEDCGEPIRAGDPILAGDDDGEWRHESCAPSGQQRLPDPEPCPRCWTVHRGECL